MLALAAALAASCSAPCSRDAGDFVLANGALGDPCRTAAQCGTGLDCKWVFDSGYTDVSTETYRACTRGCDGGCPAGFACAASRGGEPGEWCLPACGSDADCLQGKRAGRCVGPADGGAPDAGLCTPIVCGSYFQQCQSALGYGCRADGLCAAPGGGASTAPHPSYVPGDWCWKP